MNPKDRFDLDIELDRPGLSSQVKPAAKAVTRSFKGFLSDVAGGAKIVTGRDSRGPLQKGELGQAVKKTLVGDKTDQGELGGALGFAAQVPQTMVRTLGSSYLTFKQALSGKDETVRFSGAARGLVGAKEIRPFQPIVQEGSDIVRNLGGTSREETFLAPAVIGLASASDFLFGGSSKPAKQIISQLAKETSEQAVKNTLVKNFPELRGSEFVDTLSSRVARTSSAKQIEDEVSFAVEQAVKNRVYSPEEADFSLETQLRNLPETPTEGTTRVYFTKTDGDQFIATDLGTARNFSRADKPITVADVPSSQLQRVPQTDAEGSVFKITNQLADELEVKRLQLERQFSPGPKVTSPEKALGRTPSPIKTIRKREATFLRDKLTQAQSISRRAAVATRGNIKEIQDDLVSLVGDLPLQERGKFVSTIKNIQTPAQLQRAMPDIQRRVSDALKKVQEQEQTKALRRQVRQLIEQKQLKNTEAFRKALKLPSLKKMSVDDLRTFARTIAPYKPNDRFLSQRVIETIDRTSLKNLRTYREVQAVLAKEAGVSIDDLQKIKTSWYNRFQYDTALARQNPFYDVVVRKINGSLIEGNIRFAQFEDQLDELLTAARNSRPRGAGQRLVPTDDAIFKYIEAPNKDELIGTLTPEELRAANFLIERYADARDYLVKENVMNKYVQDYVTHIRRSGLEAFKQDGLVAAFKETFEQYRIDQANFNILNEKTGDVLPLEKFFAFAQQRTGNLTPTQNIARASKSYFMALERKRALDSIVPELQAYVQSVTPTRKTAKGLDFDPSLKNFLKRYINNKRGRPDAWVINPGTPPDVILRGLTAVTRIIDLGFSIPNFAAANVGEQVSTFIQQGGKQYALGVKRLNTKRGKQIVEQYRGFVGRSPWKEITDTSKNFPDKVMTMMLAGFHDASVRANKQGLLGALTPEEFKTGIISPERLQTIRVNEMGRWRALDNSASLIGSTAEGKVFMQYKAWAVPIVSSTIENLGEIIRTTSRLENPLATRAGQETMREALVVGTVALVIYAYVNEEDESFVGQMINKSVRDALSAIGALDPEMWLQTPRAWQYVQDLYDALRTLVMLEEYKSGENEGTLKGDNALMRLVTPAPIRQIGNAAEARLDGGDTGLDIGLDAAGPELDLGELDLDLDLDIGDLDLDLEI